MLLSMHCRVKQGLAPSIHEDSQTVSMQANASSLGLALQRCALAS